MSEDKIIYVCADRDCRSINEVPIDVKKMLKDKDKSPIFTCPSCKGISCISRLVMRGRFSKYSNSENGEYLGCCKYTGTTSKTAVGLLDDGTQKLFISANGDQLTRDQFIKLYHHDPIIDIKEKILLRGALDYIYSKRKEFYK